MGLSTKACTLPVQEASINRDSSVTASLDITWCHSSASDPKNLLFLRAEYSSSSMDGWVELHIFSVQTLSFYRKLPKCFHLWRTCLFLKLNRINYANYQQLILQASVHKERLKRKGVVWHPALLLGEIFPLQWVIHTCYKQKGMF